MLPDYTKNTFLSYVAREKIERGDKLNNNHVVNDKHGLLNHSMDSNDWNHDMASYFSKELHKPQIKIFHNGR